MNEQSMPVYITPPPRNPLTQLLGIVIGVAMLALGFMLGIVALAVVAGLGLALWIAAWFRGRKPVTRGPDRKPDNHRNTETIDAEYTVISRDSEPPA